MVLKLVRLPYHLLRRLTRHPLYQLPRRLQRLFRRTLRRGPGSSVQEFAVHVVPQPIRYDGNVVG